MQSHSGVAVGRLLCRRAGRLTVLCPRISRVHDAHVERAGIVHCLVVFWVQPALATQSAQTISIGFGDAPRPDEVVIAFAFASRGRLHARLGGLSAAEVRGEDGLR